MTDRDSRPSRSNFQSGRRGISGGGLALSRVEIDSLPVSASRAAAEQFATDHLSSCRVNDHGEPPRRFVAGRGSTTSTRD